MNLYFLGIIICLIAFTINQLDAISISVSTDQESYHDSDIISVFGNVESPESEFVLIIIENSDGDTIFFEELAYKTSGVFSTLLIAGGSGWEKSGPYTVYAINENTEVTSLFDFEAKKSQDTKIKDSYDELSVYLIVIPIIAIIGAGIFVVKRRKK